MSDPSAAPPPLPTVPPVDSGAAWAAANGNTPVPEALLAPADGTGITSHAFTTRRAAAEVRLLVDGQVYRCRPSSPGDPLVEALEAQQTGNNAVLLRAVRTLIRAVMFDDDRERYVARTSASDLRPYLFDEATKASRLVAEVTEDRIRAEAGPGPDPTDNPPGAEAHEAALTARLTAALAAIPELDPIDTFSMIEHGLWLVGVYLNRPTERPEPSGPGSAPS